MTTLRQPISLTGFREKTVSEHINFKLFKVLCPLNTDTAYSAVFAHFGRSIMGPQMYGPIGSITASKIPKVRLFFEANLQQVIRI